MTNPIKPELARLLKSKGFKDYSFNPQWYNKKGELQWDNILNTRNDYPAEIDECDAPVVLEVIAWLFDKYKIWVSVNNHYNKDKFYFCVRKNYDNHTNDNYPTPQEAYEKGIEYAVTKYSYMFD